MGPLGVEFVAEGREAPPLRPAVAGRWSCRGGLEGALPPFVPAVLLGVAGLDEFGLDSTLQEPDAQLGEARA